MMVEIPLSGKAKAPPAPQVTRDLVENAVTQFIQRHKLWPEQDASESAKQIAKHWHVGMDGYRLAKNLDIYESWAIDSEDVENLDSIDFVVREALEAKRKKWAAEWNIQPPLPIGTPIKFRSGTGVIAGINQYHAATYNVRETGCTDPTRHVLIQFEDAVVVEGGSV